MPRGKKPENEILEHEGFKLGDEVKLTCVAVPVDHKAKIVRIKNEIDANEIAFMVELKSKLVPDSDGEWWPIYKNELVKV